MKSPRERGEFGTWLRSERRAKFENLPTAIAEMQRRVGYGIAPSVWAELEAGSRRPSREQRERLEAFFGQTSPGEGIHDDENGRVVAINALIAAVTAQTAAMQEIAAELREQRETSQGQAEGLAAALGALTETIESLRPALAGRSR